MKFKYANQRMALLNFPVSLLSLAISATTLAQGSTGEDIDEESSDTTVKVSVNIQNPVEEVLTIGRLQSSAADLVLERLDSEVAVDLISSETISRIGDSTVGDALQRAPGVTLVDGKFVYVRGLGERNQTTLLNGAVVPSPDLTRSVVPLDIFPTSIVESLAVQKVYSADMPAAFGGGSVDIRTKGIPNSFVFGAQIGTGTHSNSGDFYTYTGGADDDLGEDDGTRAFSDSLVAALNQYQGNISPQNIQRVDNLESIEQAEAVNRQLALELNRDINVVSEDGNPDLSAELNIGNAFDIGKGFEAGFLAGVKYESSWRNREATSQGLRFLATGEPEDVEFVKRSTYNVTLTGNFSAGIKFGDDHSVETTSIFLRNTDDQVTIADTFDNDAPVTGGVSNRFYDLRYEQRELIINQIHGEHEFGYDTRDALGIEGFEFLDGLSLDWYYSDSESTTEIPNQVRVSGAAIIRPFVPFQLETEISSVERDSSAADYRFTDLQDYVESTGWELSLPIEAGDFAVEVSGGTEYAEKVRAYQQTQFGLGTISPDASLLGLPGDVFSDENIINPSNGYGITRTGSNSESYQAITKVNAAFGKVDITWDEFIRFVVGVRWEEYQQVGLDWDPYDFDGSQIIPDDQESYDTIIGSDGQETNAVAQYFEEATFVNDDFYPSAALTFMFNDFWAEDFQVRLGYGETTVRPDLREITDTSYIDPITNFLVFGNPDIVPSQYKNYDSRFEWFFSNGNNFTVSLFYKDVVNPIDQAEAAAGDNAQALEIINTESAEILGLELEFLWSLATVLDELDQFFVQGNLTFLDTETIVGDAADAATNNERELIGASDSANLIFGFDSWNEQHSATLSYNVFGERMNFAGRNGQDDVFEQPFHSLNATYSYYPTDQITVEFKAKNLLDSEVELIRSGVSIYKEEKGQSFSLSFKYKY